MNKFEKFSNAGATQEELLRSCVNVEQYDKLVFFLESFMFNNGKINCPSSYIIIVLMTLATLSEHSNSELIRNRLDIATSKRPISIRSMDILRKLVRVVEVNDVHSYDQDEIEFTKRQLFGSLDFFSCNHSRALRARGHTKRYKEEGFFEKSVNSFSSPSTKTSATSAGNDADDEQDSDTDWSPRKRLMEQTIKNITSSINMELDNNNGDNGEQHTDSEVVYILKNERIDFALLGDRIWNAIGWALKCSSINNPINYQIFKSWESILLLILDIVNLNTDETNKPFQKSLTYQLLISIARHYWDTKITDIIFTQSKSLFRNVFPNESSVCNSVLLTQKFHPFDHISIESVRLRHEIMFLALRGAQLTESSKISIANWNLDDLIHKISLELYSLTYKDFKNFLTFTDCDFKSDWKVTFIVELILSTFAQLSSYNPFQPDDINWYRDPNQYEYLKDLVQEVFIEIKSLPELENNTSRLTKFNDNLQKINLLLFQLITIWLKYSKFKPTKLWKETLISDIEIGEKKRFKYIEKLNLSTPSLKNIFIKTGVIN